MKATDLSLKGMFLLVCVLSLAGLFYVEGAEKIDRSFLDSGLYGGSPFRTFSSKQISDQIKENFEPMATLLQENKVDGYDVNKEEDLQELIAKKRSGVKPAIPLPFQVIGSIIKKLGDEEYDFNKAMNRLAEVHQSYKVSSSQYKAAFKDNVDWLTINVLGDFKGSRLDQFLKVFMETISSQLD